MSVSPRYLSTTQAGERLGMSREHVRRLIQRGELRAEETVNGFMIHVDEVERFAATRRVQRDQREFRAAVNDLAAKARRVEGATALGIVAASLRDEAKVRSAFELPSAVTTQVEWMNQQVVANAAFASLQEPVKALTEQWSRMTFDVDSVLTNTINHENHLKAIIDDTLISQTTPLAAQLAQPTATKALIEQLNTSFAQKPGESNLSTFGKGTISSILRQIEDAQTTTWQPHETRLADIAAPFDQVPANKEAMAREFVVPESREARWEEKMDALNRKVEQLAEVVMQKRADMDAAIPTWQEWAGSDRPEDVLAKLAAVREEINGGNQTDENSTDVIRAAREARGGGA